MSEMVGGASFVPGAPLKPVERAIFQRKASPGVGLASSIFPLAEIHEDAPRLNHQVCALWSRLRDTEDSRDATRRARRQLGEDAIEASWQRTAGPLEPIDQVLLVAGLIFPGLDRWRAARPAHEELADVWWNTWGGCPGAVVIRDGAMHLIGRDEDVDTWFHGPWAKWAQKHWRGPMIYHAILDASREAREKCQVAGHLIRHARGTKTLCLLWSGSATTIQPFRADLMEDTLLLRAMSEPLPTTRRRGLRLPIQSFFEISGGGIWPWLRDLAESPELVGKVPVYQFLDAPTPLTPIRVKSGSKAGGGKPAPQEQTPLLADAFTPAPVVTTPAQEAFGTRPSAETPLDELESMASGAKQELLRATMGHRPRQQAHWEAVLAEVEAAMASRSEILLARPQVDPLTTLKTPEFVIPSQEKR